MKPVFRPYLFGILLTGLLICGNAKSQTFTVFDQLSEVNKEWLKLDDYDPALKKAPAHSLPEQELIRQHLREVEQLLRKRSTAHLNPEQKANRKNHLNTLHRYWVAGRFPRNTFHPGRQPYFIDVFNTYCAVGYLMQQSGADAMARDISRSQNFSYLRDIRHPDLGKWVVSSGLSVDELALIQPMYSCYPTSIVEIHYDNSGVDQNEYIEILQAPDVFPPAILSQVQFFDHTGLLYKTLPVSGMSTFGVPTRLGGVDAYGFYYYVFPVGESLADSGMIKLQSTGGDISTFVYNSAGITVTQHIESGANTWGNVKTYPVIQDGAGPSNITLNFCGDCQTATRYNSLMPATYGGANLICHAMLPLNGATQFRYSLLNKKVLLEWQTVSESGSLHFEIERSEDGTRFSSIGNVQAAGSSNQEKKYSFTDPGPAAINYYRIKQVDLDGKTSYSKTIFVKMSSRDGLKIYPSLASDQLQVQVGFQQQVVGQLELLDLQGRILQQFTIKPGLNEIPVSRLPGGSYFLRLQTREGVLTGRFIKQ